jgi:hypothetical protein
MEEQYIASPVAFSIDTGSPRVESHFTTLLPVELQFIVLPALSSKSIAPGVLKSKSIVGPLVDLQDLMPSLTQ